MHSIRKHIAYGRREILSPGRILETTAIPNTKSRFWSKNFFSFLKRNENQDFGVFDDGDFEFRGLELKFERNWKKLLSKFRNQISILKIQNQIEFQILACGFFNFDDRFWIYIPKIQNRNRIWSFEVVIFDFSGIHYPNIFPKNEIWNFKFWQSRCLHFHSILIQNFKFLGL